MLYLIATILLATAIFIIFRLFKQLEIDNLQAITMNYVVASSFGFLVYDKPFQPSQISEADWFPLVFLIGLMFIGVFFLFALSSQKAGVAITAVSAKMSVVIPAAAGFLLFGDAFSWIKVSGIAVALAAFYFTFKKKGSMITDYAALILPVFLFLGTGTNDLLMKYIEFHMVHGDLMLLLSCIFGVALIVGLSALIFKVITGRTQLKARNFVAGFLLGFVNFGSTYFLFRSMEYFDSSLMFPIRNTGVVSLSALAGLFFFKEYLSRTNWLGIALAILAILSIAIG